MGFRVGSIVKIKETFNRSNLPKGSIVKIVEIRNLSTYPYIIEENHDTFQYYKFYSIYEVEEATDREKFLYLIYGLYIPKIKEWGDEI